MITLYCIVCYLYMIGFLANGEPPTKTTNDIVIIACMFIFAPIIVPIMIGAFHADC